MQGILTRLAGVLICWDVVCLAIELERGVLDSIRVATWHSSKVWMLAVLGVIRRVVPAKDNVSLDTVGVVDEQVRD